MAGTNLWKMHATHVNDASVRAHLGMPHLRALLDRRRRVHLAAAHVTLPAAACHTVHCAAFRVVWRGLRSAAGGGTMLVNGFLVADRLNARTARHTIY